MKLNAIIRKMEDEIALLLQSCKNITQMKKIHAHILKFYLSESSFLATKMVSICSVNGDTNYATSIFQQVAEPNIYLFNAVMQAYTQNSCYVQAVEIFQKMLRLSNKIKHFDADRFTYPLLIKSSAGLQHLALGQLIHGRVFKSGHVSNSVVENSLTTMYIRCNDMACAQAVFDRMLDRDVISWNTLILAYAKVGSMAKAKKLFDIMPYRTIISWTTMISGCCQNGFYSEALKVFQNMQVSGMNPDAVSIIAVLPACANLGALEVGKWIHVYSDRNGLLASLCVCNALIEMYVKCGNTTQAYQLFVKMPEKDVISWSTMICGLANHGQAQESIQLFVKMKRTRIKPNKITFLGVLSACAHAGFLSEGLAYFSSMTTDYCMSPTIEHYGCIVDLLARYGTVNQALEFINKMPVSPDATIWGSLLSACRNLGDLNIATIAMEQLIQLEPEEIGNYILLSNTYAAVGMWDEVSQLRKWIKNKGMKKIPGCSLIEIDNVVREFVACNDQSSLSDDTCLVLKLLAWELRMTRESAV